jgi:APA family basic amino acid/polyamine antiporter
MANDGLLPKLFSDLHPKFRTPWKSNLLLIDRLGSLTSIATLFAFIVVCIGIIILRKERPDLPRPFRTPLVPLVPILGVVVNLALMAGLGAITWTAFLIWMALGLVIYFSYSRHRSLIQLQRIPTK